MGTIQEPGWQQELAVRRASRTPSQDRAESGSSATSGLDAQEPEWKRELSARRASRKASGTPSKDALADGVTAQEPEWKRELSARRASKGSNLLDSQSHGSQPATTDLLKEIAFALDATSSLQVTALLLWINFGLCTSDVYLRLRCCFCRPWCKSDCKLWIRIRARQGLPRMSG